MVFFLSDLYITIPILFCLVLTILLFLKVYWTSAIHFFIKSIILWAVKKIKLSIRLSGILKAFRRYQLFWTLNYYLPVYGRWRGWFVFVFSIFWASYLLKIQTWFLKISSLFLLIFLLIYLLTIQVKVLSFRR